MDVLEKILEEIEERIKRLNEADNMCRVNAERNRNFESMKYFQSFMFATERAESIIGDIIRSHMDEAKDINVNNADAPYITLTLNENGVAEVYDDTYDVTVHCESEEEQERVVGILERYPGWIPVEDTEHTPEDESYVLVSFSNFPLPDIARYEENDEGGTYYPGDDEKSYLNYGLFVNAWMPIPKPYREDIKTNEGSENDV